MATKKRGKKKTTTRSRGGSKGGSGNSFQKRLSKMKKAWGQKREESKKSQFDFPGDDGDYFAQLTEAKIVDKVYGKDELGVQFSFKCLADKEGDTEHEGAYMPRVVDSLEDEERLVWVFRNLAKLGVDVDNFEIETIEETLEELTEEPPTVLMRVVTNEAGYTNGNLLRLADEEEVPETEEDEGDEDDDDDEEGDEEETDESDEEEDESDEEEDDEEAVEPAKGDRVEVDFDGEMFGGEVKTVNKSKQTAKVAFDDDTEEVVAWADLVFPDAEEADDEDEDEDEDDEGSEEEEVDPKKGDTVVFDDPKTGKEVEGTVTSVSKTNKTLKVKVGKSTKTVDWDDATIIIPD